MLKKQRNERLWYAWVYAVAPPEKVEGVTVSVRASAASDRARQRGASVEYKVMIPSCLQYKLEL